MITQARREQENAQRLAIAGKVSDTVLDDVLRDTAERITAAQAKLDQLDTPSRVQVADAYLSTNLNAMGELAVLLADETIPLDDRRAALRDVGVERIYIDRPHLQTEFLPADAAVLS